MYIEYILKPLSSNICVLNVLLFTSLCNNVIIILMINERKEFKNDKKRSNKHNRNIKENISRC